MCLYQKSCGVCVGRGKGVSHEQLQHSCCWQLTLLLLPQLRLQLRDSKLFLSFSPHSLDSHGIIAFVAVEVYDGLLPESTQSIHSHQKATANISYNPVDIEHLVLQPV